MANRMHLMQHRALRLILLLHATANYICVIAAHRHEQQSH